MSDEQTKLDKPQDSIEGTDELADEELEEVSGGVDSFAQESNISEVKHESIKSTITNARG
jgi:hypothetical protein